MKNRLDIPVQIKYYPFSSGWIIRGSATNYNQGEYISPTRLEIHKMKEKNKSDAEPNVRQDTFNEKKDRDPSRKVSSVFLSSQQKKCALYAIKGLSNREIAEHMGISYWTAKEYIEIIKKKVNCKSKAHALQALIRSNFLSLDMTVSEALESEVD